MLTTQRPAPLDDGECSAWPKCGRDVTGHCPCAPTVRVPGPDQVAAYVRLYEEHDLLTTRLADAGRALSLAELADAACRIEARRRTPGSAG